MEPDTPPVRTSRHDWLGLHKQIAGTTLLIGLSALVCNVAWITVLADDSPHYRVDDIFLIAGIVLIIGLAMALMRSANRVVGAERDWARANAEFLGSQARLTAVVKYMPVGVVVVEAGSGKLLLANDQHEKLLKYALVTGQHFWEQMIPPRHRKDGETSGPAEWPIARALRHGEVVLDEERWCERGDGLSICLSINAAPIYDSKGAISAAVMAFTDVTERKQLAEEHAAMARRLVNAQESERHRIARELHDEMGQDLTALSLGVKSLEDGVAADDLKNALADLRKIIEHLSIQVHHTASKLRPTLLNDLGLRQAVEDMVTTWAERLSISADIHLEALSTPLGDEGAVTVYRVVQEALTNVAKHSRASWISVIAQQAEGQLRVVVEDDGTGFNTEAIDVSSSGGFGLSGMRERLALVGGDFAIESAESQGTTIYASLPLTDLPQKVGLQ